MKALACTLDTWDAFARATGRTETTGLTFPLRILEIIGKPYGLELEYANKLNRHDAVFIAVHDFSSMLSLGKAMQKLKLPLLAKDRDRSHPLVWMGGQGTRNPLPIADIADLIVLGDAELSMPQLLQIWERTGNSREFLVGASTVSGVFVPSIHNENEVTLKMGWAPDIRTSLQSRRLPMEQHARIELSRGCKSKCSFCGLGWMGPVRHNTLDDVRDAIRGVPSVHLQACDAEAYPDIVRLREWMRERGIKDTGCTSRLDSNYDARSEFLFDKLFNFGIEAVTERVRRKIGKARLTNDFIVEAMCGLYERQKARKGEACEKTNWHMISGLPGELVSETAELAQTIRRLDATMLERRITGQLTIRWQPLLPCPGTPLQWLPIGPDCEPWSKALARNVRKTYCLKLEHGSGRQERKHALTCILMRSGRVGAKLIALESKSAVTPIAAAELTGTTTGELDLSGPLPWDFVHGYYPRGVLEKAYKKTVQCT
jgi:Radical SAM proteins, N-terminal